MILIVAQWPPEAIIGFAVPFTWVFNWRSNEILANQSGYRLKPVFCEVQLADAAAGN
jgi:hypothetical protein